MSTARLLQEFIQGVLPLRKGLPRGSSPYGAAKGSPAAIRNLETNSFGRSGSVMDAPPPPTRFPVQTSEIPGLAPDPVQLNLIRQLQEATPRARGRFQSYKGPKGAAGARNRETVELSNQPRMADAPPPVVVEEAGTPLLRGGAIVPRQESGITPYINTGATVDLRQAPAPLWTRGLPELRAMEDPGTMRSLDDLAVRASEYYGRPVSVSEVIMGKLPMSYTSREAASVASDGAAFSDDLGRVVARGGNAAGGVQVGSLRDALLPIAAGVGGTGLFGGLLYKLAQGQGQGQDTPTMTGPDGTVLPIGGPMTSASPSAGGGAYGVPAAGTGSYGSPSTPGQIGSGGVTIRTNGADSNYIQMKQRAAAGIPGEYKAPGDMASYARAKDYYTDRQNYVSQPGVAEDIVSQLSQIVPGFDAWARANPALAYQLLMKSAPKGESQQSPSIQGSAVVAPMGSNNENNMIGNIRESITPGGSPDLRGATEPALLPTLSPVPVNRQRTAPFRSY